MMTTKYTTYSKIETGTNWRLNLGAVKFSSYMLSLPMIWKLTVPRSTQLLVQQKQINIGATAAQVPVGIEFREWYQVL